MSFLCVLSKKESTNCKPLETSTSKVEFADVVMLESLLCPYKGEVRSVDVPNGSLYISDLADLNQTGSSNLDCVIPKNTRKNAQTSWVDISTSDSEMLFKTDPMGTFPIWYFEDEERLLITSEVKSLKALIAPRSTHLCEASLSISGKRASDFSPFKAIKRLKPGATLTVTEDLTLIVDGDLPLVYEPNRKFETVEEAKEALFSALSKSAREIGLGSEQISTFLSGGIDSSITTSLLTANKLDVSTYTLGTEFGNEYADAADLSEFLGLEHQEVFAEHSDAKTYFEKAVISNETVDGLSAETIAQLSILANATDRNVGVVATGYGADLLFGSMLRHELYMQVTGVDDLKSLIERTCWTNEFSPFYAWSLGIEVHHLFWDPDVMNCAFQIPDAWNFDGIREKLPLRSMAVEQGLMQTGHAFRKKHAMTDGTQFNRVLSEAYDLSGPHAYSEKDQLCSDILKKTLSGELNKAA